MVSLLDIILTFAKIGVLSFGGGYAAIPIVQQQVVEINQWMSVSEFSDIVAIDELTPGPVAINAATFVGMKMAGVPGAICATIGCILPSCLIALAFAWLYRRFRKMKAVSGVLDGLRSMAVGLISSTALSITLNNTFENGVLKPKSLNILAVIIFVIAFVLFRKFKKKLNPIVILIGCGIISLIYYSLTLA